MEIETPSVITFDKLISHYSFLDPSALQLNAKAFDKKISLEVLPPFVIARFDAKEDFQIDFRQLLQIWHTRINKGFPKTPIQFENNNIFYVTRYEESIMIAKNQDGESLFFVGKFGLGEVVLFSHAGVNVEKMTRLKALVNLYNSIVQKPKPQIEKKK